jgi:hypothetical protein
VLTLLDERYAPITSRFGFLRVPLREFAEAMLAWNRSLYGKSRAEHLTGSLNETLPALQPLVMAVRPRQLLVATTGDWTAYFDCLANGTDPVSPIGYLSEQLKCHGLIVQSQPAVPPGGPHLPARNGAVQFELLGPEPTEWLNSVRAISAISDGGRWHFETGGQVQPFEDTERYRARRIRDRFTSGMLAEYCHALGVRPFDPDFYAPQAILVHSRTGRGLGKETIEQAQRRLGIVPGTAAALPG